MESRLFKFATVVDEGGVSAAARKLHISQPALTAAIHKLEREVGTSLVSWEGRVMRVTPAGQAAYTAAQRMQLIGRQLQREVAHLQGKKPTLRLGLIDSVADLITCKGDMFAALEREAHISLTVHNSHQLRQLVHKGELDAAFIVAPKKAYSYTGLRRYAIGHEPLVAVCSKQQYPLLQSLLSAKQPFPFLAYNKGSTTYAATMYQLEAQGLRPEPVFYSTSPEIINRLMQSGRGVAVLPFILVSKALFSAESSVLPLAGDGILSRPIECLAREGDAPTIAIEQVAELLQSVHAQALSVVNHHRRQR